MILTQLILEIFFWQKAFLISILVMFLCQGLSQGLGWGGICLIWLGDNNVSLPVLSCSAVWLCDSTDGIAHEALSFMEFFRQDLEQVATSYTRGSSWLKDPTHAFCVSCLGKQILSHCTTWEAPYDFVWVPPKAELRQRLWWQ